MASKKILFICTVNRLRSRTADTIFSQYEDLEVKSAGTDKSATVHVSRELLEWADLIVVMEKKHRNWIGSKFRDIYKTKPIKCLYIPDDYEYMDPHLIDLLRHKMSAFLPADLK